MIHQDRRNVSWFHEIKLPFTSVSLAVASAAILARAASAFKFIWIVVDVVNTAYKRTLYGFSRTSQNNILSINVRTLAHVSFRRSNTYVTPAGTPFTITGRFLEAKRGLKKRFKENSHQLIDIRFHNESCKMIWCLCKTKHIYLQLIHFQRWIVQWTWVSLLLENLVWNNIKVILRLYHRQINQLWFFWQGKVATFYNWNSQYILKLVADRIFQKLEREWILMRFSKISITLGHVS